MGGIELKVGTFSGGLWFDKDDQVFYGRSGYGIKLAVRWGPWVCPIKKPWSKLGRWDAPWFIIRGKWGIWPFISVAVGKCGFYLGAKDNGWGLNNILIISASIRRDRTK